VRTEDELEDMPEDPVDHLEDLEARHVEPEALQEAEEALLAHWTRADLTSIHF